MKNRNLKIIGLFSLLMLAYAIHSCKKDDEFFEKHAPNPTRRIERINKREMDRYYKHIFDSIYNGEIKKSAEKIGGKMPHQTRSIYQDEADIRGVMDKTSLSTTMDAEILASGQTILTCYQNKIENQMARYNLSIMGTGVEKYFVANNVQDLLFIGVGSEFNEDIYWIGKNVIADLTRDINDIIDRSNCNGADKQNLKLSIAKILKDMETSLIANRKSVEQKYSDYYLLGEFGQMSLGVTQYNYENAPEGSYKMLDWLNCKYLITTQSIGVYTENVPLDFLQDETATYKLVSVAPNQWRIEKTMPNGKKMFSETFFDAQRFEKNVNESDTPKEIGASGFSYVVDTPGITIYYNEITNVAQRKKDWPLTMSEYDKQKTDSLTREINRKREMERAINSAWKRADSVARVMTIQHFDSLNNTK